MVLLGIILLVIGAALAALALTGALASTSTVHLEAFGLQRDSAPVELVIVGGVAVLLFCIGWAAIASRARRVARTRRERREEERLADVERAAESERTEHARRMEEAGLRDEDFTRRESELAARHEELTTRHDELAAREQDLSRREAEYRQQVGPSVADVVTGRAEGNVADGTAEWVDDGTDTPTDPESRR